MRTDEPAMSANIAEFKRFFRPNHCEKSTPLFRQPRFEAHEIQSCSCLNVNVTASQRQSGRLGDPVAGDSHEKSVEFTATARATRRTLRGTPCPSKPGSGYLRRVVRNDTLPFRTICHVEISLVSIWSFVKSHSAPNSKIASM